MTKSVRSVRMSQRGNARRGGERACGIGEDGRVNKSRRKPSVRRKVESRVNYAEKKGKSDGRRGLTNVRDGGVGRNKEIKGEKEREGGGSREVST